MAASMEQHGIDHANKGEELLKLKQTLDELFEQYLNLLDQYQTTRQQLSAQLSSGYLSLAQANFASTSRARYGQDYYDERMQALRKINIIENTPEGGDYVVTCCLDSEERGKPETEPESGSEEEQNQTKNEGEKGQSTKDQGTECQKSSRDPIIWFGVLVPPPLRSAQSKFVEIVEGPIPRLVTLTKGIRTLEMEIGRIRKSIKKLEKL